MALRRSLCHFLGRGFHVNVGKVPAIPGGLLKVKLPSSCTLNLSPINPHTADWNHVEVHLKHPPKNGPKLSDTDSKKKLEQLGVTLKSELDKERTSVILSASPYVNNDDSTKWSEEMVIDVYLPGLFDLDIETGCGAVNVNGTIEGDVKIRTLEAAVTIEKLKSMQVNIGSHSGTISAAVVQGHVSITSGTGNIIIGKVQGPQVRLETSSGNIQAQAMYTEKSLIKADQGSILVEGSQGETNISTGDGDANVSGVQGKLTIESNGGDVSAQLSQPEDVSLFTKRGNVSVGISDRISATVQLQSEKRVDIDPQISLSDIVEPSMHTFGGVIVPRGSTDLSMSRIKATAPSGQIRLYVENWGSKFAKRIARG